MRRGVTAVGAIIVAGLIIERIRATAPDVIHRPQAYCLNCKTRREIDKPLALVMRNRRTGVKGSCPVCRKGLFSVGNKVA